VYWSRGLAVATELADADEIISFEDRLAAVDWERGDLESTAEHFESRVDHYRASGDRVAEANTLHLLGELKRDLGRFDEAEALLLDADGVYRELGHEAAIQGNLHSLGDLALDRGDLETALPLYRDALAMARDLALDREAAYCLAGIACVLAETGEDEAAATIWGAVGAAEESLGFRMIPMERVRYERRVEPLEDTPAWITGRRLSLDDAAALVPPLVSS
jgi:tetratricopeptide (TPR) repeat protein